jgi:glycosyltransferase involved in cell wall biosynthesis
MNIEFFITSLSGGGAERVVCNLASYLVQHNHRIRITALRGDDLSYEVDEKVKINYLQKEYYRHHDKNYRYAEIKVVRAYFKQLSLDGVLACFLELPVAFSLIMRSIIKCKLIICERNNPLFYPKHYQWIFKALAHRADACVCQTEVNALWYDRVMEKPIVVIPNPVSNTILSAPYSDHRDKTIITLGRLSAQKNQRMMIEAFAQIAKDYPDYSMIIYGEGPLRKELEDLTKQLGIERKVSFPGFVDDVVEVMQHASMFVMTSDHEGMPNALQEAMAMRLPCISTDCGGGGARALIQNGINGVLIKRNDKEALVNEMQRILNDKDYAALLSSMASGIRRDYRPEILHEKWENFFATICV